MNRRNLKPYHGILLIVVCGCIIFFLNPILGEWMGLYGTLAGELLMLGAALLITAVFRADFKQVFPIHKPKLAPFFGTLLIWFSSFVGVMVLTLIISYFFPKEVLGASQGLQDTIVSVPVLLSLLIVAVTPAICEEAVFRGVVVNSFRPMKSKWAVIVVSGLIFGAFHGSVVRAIPTGLLGMVMAYILFETDNIVYTALFHFTNNAASIVLMFLLRGFYENPAVRQQAEVMSQQGVPLISVAAYMIWGTMVPFGLYVGSYLLHHGREGFRRGLFPKDDKTPLIVLIILTGAIFLSGVMLMAGAVMTGQFHSFR